MNANKCRGTLGYRVCPVLTVVAWIIFCLLAISMIGVVVLCCGCRSGLAWPGETKTELRSTEMAVAAQPSITLVWSNQEMWIGNQVDSAAHPDGPWQLYARMTNGTNFVVSFTVPKTNGWRFYRVGAFRP